MSLVSSHHSRNMQEITELQHDKIKLKAVEIFQQNKKITSPAFWEIRITPEGFGHIEWKNKNHKRPIRESYVRYLCFTHIVHILNHSKLYQEFRETLQTVEIKKKGKKNRENKIVHFYGFVAIVNNNKNRVKIVVRKVDGWNHVEFVSVIPVWKSWWYSWEMFFDEDMSFLEDSHQLEDTKKAIREE